VTATTVAVAIVLGLAAGILSGAFGVGGGILFVPALVGLGLGQVEAVATSLLAIVPTAAVGVSRHYAFGTVRVRSALVLGATSLSESALRRLFAALLLGVAVQLAWGAVRSLRRYADAG
jgi:uncharacterized membrane protein YfcA